MTVHPELIAENVADTTKGSERPTRELQITMRALIIACAILVLGLGIAFWPKGCKAEPEPPREACLMDMICRARMACRVMSDDVTMHPHSISPKGYLLCAPEERPASDVLAELERDSAERVCAEIAEGHLILFDKANGRLICGNGKGT